VLYNDIFVVDGTRTVSRKSTVAGFAFKQEGLTFKFDKICTNL